MVIPSTQHAVQIVGPDDFIVATAKPVDAVGPHQMLMEVEACGICFSDTKLLHAFDQHPRKAELAGGLSVAELREIPSYHPGAEPTVPGHEPVGRIVAAGELVSHFAVGDRVLVQADWKHLPTKTSSGAFGYNFEGALQEYVVIDERCVVSPSGEEMLLHVSATASAASLGLIEPWATVEGAYSGAERVAPLLGGRMLVAIEEGAAVEGLAEIVSAGSPGVLVRLEGAAHANRSLDRQLDFLDGQLFDDIIYFGSRSAFLGRLGGLLDNHGLLNTVLGGRQLDGLVSIDIGRVHYDFIRYCGTPGSDPAAGYAWLPESAALRAGERLTVIGAAGPMGLMHTVRAVSSGIPGLSVPATDLSDERLRHLRGVVSPLADERGVSVDYLNTERDEAPSNASYVVCLVPVPAVVAQAVESAGEGAIINAFAGIPAGVTGQLNLQRIIDKQVFLTGSSGSDQGDMVAVLERIESGALDTTISLDAVCGMAGFPDAIRSVIERTSSGKIVVYPSLHDLPLVRLVDLAEVLPTVAAELVDGRWTSAAEHALLATRNR